MSFGKGQHVLRSGHRAVIAKVRSVGVHFLLQGAIEDQTDGKLFIHSWTHDGVSLMPGPREVTSQWDIVKKVDE